MCTAWYRCSVRGTIQHASYIYGVSIIGNDVLVGRKFIQFKNDPR